MVNSSVLSWRDGLGDIGGIFCIWLADVEEMMQRRVVERDWKMAEKHSSEVRGMVFEPTNTFVTGL
jgi:hypothetical protein